MNNSRQRIIKFILISAGTICVVCGVVGIFLPILPTTPFLLLAAFFYARSSERFLNWLLTNRWFGAYIRNYREGNGIPLREKVLTITLLWATIIFSVLYVVTNPWVKVLLAGIAIGVTAHLLHIKTYKPQAKALSNSVTPSPEENSGEI